MGEQKKNIWADFRPKRRKPLSDNPRAGVLAIAIVGAIGFCLGALAVLGNLAQGGQGDRGDLRTMVLGGGIIAGVFAVSLGLPGLYFYHRRRPEEDEDENEEERE